MPLCLFGSRSDSKHYKPAQHTTTGWRTYNDSTTINYMLQGSPCQCILSHAGYTPKHDRLGRSRSPKMLCIPLVINFVPCICTARQAPSIGVLRVTSSGALSRPLYECGGSDEPPQRTDLLSCVCVCLSVSTLVDQVR